MEERHKTAALQHEVAILKKLLAAERFELASFCSDWSEAIASTYGAMPFSTAAEAHANTTQTIRRMASWVLDELLEARKQAKEATHSLLQSQRKYFYS